MRRVNMQLAFIGEPDGNEDFSHTRDGNEQAIFEVTGGTISFVVDNSVADDAVTDNYEHIQGEVLLEGGKVLRFQIYADGASTSEVLDKGEQTVVDGDLNSTQATLPG